MVKKSERGKTFPIPAKVIPPISKRALLREHLFQKLDKLLELKTIWVSSPAGSGKTTLISTYLQNRGVPCLWYQVDMGDDDPATFFHYLGMAALRVVSRARKDLPALTPERISSLPAFSMRFFEDLSTHLLCGNQKKSGQEIKGGKRYAIVFDNCHEVAETSSFHSILVTGLSRVSPGITVIFISRSPPPPLYTRLLANDQLGLLEWSDLRLSIEETGQIIRMRNDQAVEQDIIERIYQATDGWAAGITLMLTELKRKECYDLKPQSSTPEEIMEYFGAELFDRLDTSIRDFLLKTAFLSIMTPETARKLTGNFDSGKILSSLYRNNYFIQKHFQHGRSSYAYHPLFREFLVKAAKEILTDMDFKTTLTSASAILERSGQIESAMDLLKDISNWGDIVPFIIKNAPVLIEQGRYRTLQNWFAAVPDSIVESHPWLMYWKGTSLMPYDPDGAKRTLEKAFDLFSSSKEMNGMLPSLCSIIESIQMSFSDFSQYEPWIPLIEDLFSSIDKIPEKDLEARLLDGMITALVLYQPDHSDLDSWVNRAVSVLEQSISSAANPRLIHAVLFCSILQFDVPRMDHAYGYLKLAMKSKDMPPMDRLLLYLIEANYHAMKASHEECLKTVDKGLALAREVSIRNMDHFFMCHAAMSYLNENEPVKAGEIIDKLTESYGQFNQWEKKAFHQVKAREALIVGDIGQASLHARKNLSFIIQLGLRVHIALGRFILSQAMHVSGRHEEEQQYIIASLEDTCLIEQAAHHFYTFLLQAACAFDRGDNEGGYKNLKESFSIGREHEYLGTLVDIPSETAKLCVRAIEAGVEPEYARWLVKKRRFIPNPPPYHLEGWPWPVKIHTLGRFSLTLDEEPLSFSNRAQKKPLDVLKIILSGGGANVSEASVTDTLWPEADGDMAMQAFSTNLHRLRKLLRRPNAVLLQNGILSLDPNICWIDARAFEVSLNNAGELWCKAESDTDCEKACDLISSALALYKGEFLPDEESITGAIAMREHLHTRFLQGLYNLGEYLIKTGKCERARESLERGIEIDQCAEEIYQLLMICFARLGLRTEALNVYERCKSSLSSLLNTLPSEETTIISEKIRRGKSIMRR